MLEIDLSEAMLVQVSRAPANRPLWSVWSKVFADPKRGDAISDDICHAKISTSWRWGRLRHLLRPYWQVARFDG